MQRKFSYLRKQREPVTPDIDIITQRNAPPLFGIGLIETIPAADILANADPIDADFDGISGRVNRDGTVVGRFGYKAQESSVEEFTRAPIFAHMGITTNPLSAGPLVAGVTVAPQVSGPPELPTIDLDGVPDPELSFQDLFDVIFFASNLAPPQRLPMNAQAARGEELFTTIGCANCHIQNIVRTGTPINAFTDLLLHDMGPELADGMRQGDALGNEFRTQPLWGLRHHAPYLHDGRGETIRDAITFHGGEAEAARNQFNGLSIADQDALIAFLETL